MILAHAFYCEGSCVEGPGPFETLELRFAPLLVRSPEGGFQALLISKRRHSIRRWKEHLLCAGVTVRFHHIFKRGGQRTMRERAELLLREHERVHQAEAPPQFAECLQYLDQRRRTCGAPSQAPREEPPPLMPLSAAGNRGRHLFRF